jgi:hypothetical protein
MSNIPIAVIGKKTILPKELQDTLVGFKRMGMHDNASTLIASFLFAVDEGFRAKSTDIQEEIVKKTRKTMVKIVKTNLAPSSEEERDTYIEGFDAFLAMFDESRSVQDYLKELKNTDEPCPAETLALLETIHKVKALVFAQENQFHTFDCDKVGKKRQHILLLKHKSGTYEPLVQVKEDGEVQSIFSGKEDVIQNIIRSTTLCKTGDEMTSSVVDDFDSDSDESLIVEDELDEEDIVFMDEVELDDIVRVVQKQLDFVVYTPDQLMNALHEILSTKGKRPYFKRSIETFMNMYASLQAQPSAKSVVVETIAKKLQSGDLNVSSGLLPIVHVTKDTRKDLEYLTGRYNIMHSTDSTIQKRARVFQHQAPFQTPSDTEISSYVIKRDLDAIIDLPPGRQQRFIGAIPFYLLNNQHAFMYEGDALIVQGFAYGAKNNGKMTTFNVSEYMRRMKRVRKGDSVVVYPNIFVYDEHDQVVEKVRATIIDATTTHLKLKLDKSVKPSGKHEFLRNVLVYAIHQPNPFYLYAVEDEDVFHKTLLSTRCFAFERDDNLSLDALLNFILPTPSEFSFVFRQYLDKVHNISDLQSLLTLCGLDNSTIPQATFEDIKTVLDKNVSSLPSTFGKIPPKLDYTVPKRSKISKPSWLRNTDLIQTLYPDIAASHEVDVMFALQRKSDQGRLMLLQHYQDYLKSKLAANALSGLNTKLDTLKRMIDTQQSELDTLDERHMVSVKELAPVEYETEAQCIETNGRYIKELHQRFAIVGKKLYKRIQLHWVPIGTLDADGRYNMLSVYSTYLPYVQDIHDVRALSEIRPYLATQREIERLKTTEKALLQWLDSSADVIDKDINALHTFKVTESKPHEMEYKKSHIGGSTMKGTRLEDDNVFITDKYDALTARNMPLVQDVVEEVQEEDPKSKRRWVKRMASAASVVLQGEHIQMILDNLPEFEEVLLKTKLQALMKSEKNQGKPIDKKELLKRLAKDETAMQNTLIIILAFLSILVYAPNVSFEAKGMGDCELKAKTPQDVREYITCCALNYSKDDAVSMFSQADKLGARVEQTALYILEKRAALKMMIDAAKDSLMKEQTLVTKGEEWLQFRPPLHISKAQRVSSAPVSQFIFRVVQSTAKQRPLKVNMAKQAVFDNSCCLEPLSSQYTYWASSKTNQPEHDHETTQTYMPSIHILKRIEEKDVLPNPDIRQKHVTTLDVPDVEEDVTDMMMQLKRVMDANPLLAHDSVLKELAENPDNDDAWRALSQGKQAYWSLLEEKIGGLNQKKLTDVYLHFDYPEDKLPAVLKGFSHFLQNAFRRYTAQVFNRYHPQQRAAAALPAFHQKYAVAISAAHQQYDPKLETLLDATSQHSFFKDAVSSVEKVVTGMGQNIHCLHFIAREDDVNSTFKSLYILSYVFLKNLVYLLWSLGGSDKSLKKLVKKDSDISYLEDGIDDALANREVASLIKEWIKLVLQKGVSVIEEHLVNEEVYKQQIKTLRELKKTEAIKRYEQLPDELRGLVKRLEEIGAVSIRDRKFDEAAAEDDQAFNKDQRAVEEDIDKAAEDGEYILGLHEKGENEDDMDDDDYDDDAF